MHIAAYFGAAFSVGFASVCTGIGQGYTAGKANYAAMKQPKSLDVLLRSMLVSQAVTETGAIFSLVVALLLIFGGLDKAVGGFYEASALIAAGIAMGLGSVGPGFGSGYTGGLACDAIGRMPKKQNEINGNMLIGQALSQASSIFALVVALLLLYATPTMTEASTANIVVGSVANIGAGLAIGIGTFGPGSAIGLVGGKASNMIARYSSERSLIMRTMFVGAAVAESTAIYSLVIAFLLMFAI